MQGLFESIFSDGNIEIYSFFIVIIVGLLIGVVFSLVSKKRINSTKNFFIAEAVLPCCVAMVIMLVNGNIGAGVAVAGAFSLVRFRSACGNALEISIIFIDMVIGLTLGMGYILYGIIFAIIVIIALLVLNNTKILMPHENDLARKLKIVVPENVDYVNLFNDIFAKYTKSYKLNKAKLCNMGSMIQLNYEIELNDNTSEKSFIDEIRCRNGNLEIVMERVIYEEKDL